MADVTISQLTKGIPAGNSILPYSTGSDTLGVPVSALLQNTNNVGIGVNGSVYGNNLILRGSDSSTFIGKLPLGLGILNGGNYDLAGIDFKNITGNSLAGRIGVEVTSGGGTMKFGTSNNYATGITNTALTIDPSGNVDITGPSLRTKGYNHIESACLNITEATQTRLQNNTTNIINNAYLEFGFSNNRAFISNNNIFEIITTAPQYGLKIKKSGYLKIDVSQDIISSTTPVTNGYVQLFIYKNGSRVSAHLIRPTNGFWDNLVGSQILQVTENDIITMTINCYITGYTTKIDWAEWSYYNFMFWS